MPDTIQMPTYNGNEIIVIENANLEKHPGNNTRHPHKNSQLTLGDLHGNALKLLYFMVSHGVAKISEEDYDAFVGIYNKGTDDLTQDDLNQYNDILSRIVLNKDIGMLRLIGDTLADRGQNDWFTLKLFEKISRAGVPFEILFSNHDEMALEHHRVGTLRPTNRKDSAARLTQLVKKNLVSEADALALVNNHYQPNLKALSYSVDHDSTPKQLSIYTHAAVGLETIEALAKYYSIEYRGDTAENIIKTIDAINIAFNKDNKRPDFSPTPSTLSDDQQAELDACLGRRMHIPCYAPLQRVIWNTPTNIEKAGTLIAAGIDESDLTRYGEAPELPAQLTDGTKLQFVHGHVGEKPLNFEQQAQLANAMKTFNIAAETVKKDNTEENQAGFKLAQILYEQEEKELYESPKDHDASYRPHMINLDNKSGKGRGDGFNKTPIHTLHSRQQGPAPSLTTQVYQSVKNQETADKIVPHALALQDYIQDRQAQEDNNKGRFYQKGEHHYATFFGRMADLPRIDGRAYSGKAKCQAAQKMMTALKGGEATFFNDDIVALEQGRLGKMTAALKAADLLPEAFNQAKEANTWGSWLKMKVANMCGGR